MAEVGLPEDPEAEPSEVEYLVSDITHIVTCLFKFSSIIRNPAPTERLDKLALINVSSFEHQDIEDIKKMFQYEVAGYLTKRLGKANTRRRQLLMYYKAHHTEFSDDPLPSKSTIERNELTNVPKPVSPTMEDARAGGARAPTTVPDLERAATLDTTTNSQTAVSNERTQEVEYGLNEEDLVSQTSYATSTNHTIRARVPSPPDGDAAFGGEPFECPYCFNKIKIRSPEDWKYVGYYACNFYRLYAEHLLRKHVFEDLQPYVCTLPKCWKPNALYSSQQEWFDHEVQLHRREWYCDACLKRFSHKSKFQEHIQESHTELVPEQHFDAVTSRCERAITTEIKCPLCEKKFALQTLEKHLGLHLQEVALSVLLHPGEGSKSKLGEGKGEEERGRKEKEIEEKEREEKEREKNREEEMWGVGPGQSKEERLLGLLLGFQGQGQRKRG